MESGDGLHEDQRWLQELLCGAAGVALAGDGKCSAIATAFSVTLHEDVIDLPRTWKKPRRIFVNSMSDLFHPDVPLWFIRRVFQTMEECPQHSFQVLTKRSDRVRSWPRSSVAEECLDGSERGRQPRLCIASMICGKCRRRSGSSPGTAHRVARRDRSAGDSLGDCGRRIGAACAADGGAMGARNLSRLPEAEGAVLLQAMGRVQKHRTGRELGGRTYDEMPIAAQRLYSVDC